MIMNQSSDGLRSPAPVRHRSPECWVRGACSAGPLLGLIALGLFAAWAAGWYLFIRPNDAKLLQDAVRSADHGEITSAIVLFDEVLKRNPTQSTALLYRGQLAIDVGDRADAARFLGRVPDNPVRTGATARYLEAMLFRHAHRARDAEAALLKSLRLNPDYLPAHEQLLELYVLQLREFAIQEQLDAIRRHRPLTPRELYELVFRAGIAPDREMSIPSELSQFVAADRDDVESQVSLARYSANYGSLHEATAILQDLRSKRPHDLSIRAWLAELFVVQADLKGAREVLSRAPAAADSLACVWKSHGLFWMASGEWQRATTCWQRYLEMNPNDFSAEYQFVSALRRAGDSEAAERQYEHLKILAHLRAQAGILVQHARSDSERQSHIVGPVIEIGMLLMKLNRHAEAAAFFESALEIAPNAELARESYTLTLERLQRGSDGKKSGSTTTARRGDQSGTRPALDEASDVSPAEIVVRRQDFPSVHFVDRHDDTELEFQYFNGETGQKSLLGTTGGGVAVLDYDGDGWPDLYFPQGCPIPFDPDNLTYMDRLYRNRGGDVFADVTASAGLRDNQYSQGCAAGDYNHDGFPDLAVANFGTNVIYQNNGDGTFADVTVATGISGEHWSTSLGWGDFDRDGNLDLYVVNYVHDPGGPCPNEKGIHRICNPRRFTPAGDALYMSRGDGTFDDRTRAAGMVTSRGRGLGVVIADLDDDGWPDVFVANDGDANLLFQNLDPHAHAGLKFSEQGLLSGTALAGDGTSQAAMGVACGDLDGDGRLDLYVTNFYREADTLYLNRGALVFEEAAARAGLAEPTRFMLGWGTQAIDVDLDGRLELFQTNGHLDDLRDEGQPWKMPAQLFYNLGSGRFHDISRASGEFFYGEYLGRGVARLDWNRDGRPDLVVVHQDRPVALLSNETPATGRRLILELRGVQSNRDAIGTRIRVTHSGTLQVLELCGGDGFLATNERRQIVGIGTASHVDVLEIRWPSGRLDRWRDVPGNSAMILIEGQPPRTRRLDVDGSRSDDRSIDNGT